MMIAVDLSVDWHKLVERGQIAQRFTDRNGRPVEIGVRIGPNGGPDFYGRDLRTGEDIDTPVVESTVEGSAFMRQYNPFRGLRVPPVLNVGRQPDLPSDVNLCRFECQNPGKDLSLLRRESLLQVRLRNFRWLSFPNAAPFEKHGHFLWVPCHSAGGLITLPHWPQRLTQPIVDDFLHLVTASENLITFFNSVHAGATVNHFHLQSVHCQKQLAIQKAGHKKAGEDTVLTDYPVEGLFFEKDVTADRLWARVEPLQNAGLPFNLIAASDGLYLIVRNADHEITDEFPYGVLASMELAGKLIISEKIHYDRVSHAGLVAALAKTALRVDSFAKVLRGS